LYAGTQGFVNDVETNRLQNWASGVIPFVHERHGDIPSAIAQSGQLADETKKKLDVALAAFNKAF
jgi:F-type H+/Na+-transporting ATPase subunit alpha